MDTRLSAHTWERPETIDNFYEDVLLEDPVHLGDRGSLVGDVKYPFLNVDLCGEYPEFHGYTRAHVTGNKIPTHIKEDKSKTITLDVYCSEDHDPMHKSELKQLGSYQATFNDGISKISVKLSADQIDYHSGSCRYWFQANTDLNHCSDLKVDEYLNRNAPFEGEITVGHSGARRLNRIWVYGDYRKLENKYILNQGMDYQLYSTYLPFFSVPEHKTTYRIKGVPCSKLQNCSRESRHTVVYSPTESFSSRKITVSSSVIGDSTSISVATQFQQLKIESPSSDTSSFLVNTRKNDKESGPSLVENENRMKFRGNIQPDPSVPARIKWRVYGPDIDNDTFTTPDGESRKLNLTGPRREDGSPARKVNIEARAAVDGETLTATHTVQQGQGDTYDYSVIRQEYEDVGYTELPANEVPYSGPDGEPRETDFMPSSSDFYKDPVAIPHSADFPAQRFNGESSFSSKDYDYHIHQKNVLNGLKNAINNMTDAERQAVLQANEYFYLYSNYRTPETNKNDSGVADSTHMEGRALDIDTLDHTNHENRWDVLFEFQITNCEALGRFLRQEAGATATHEDGDYETYCPDGEDDSTADESKVHAAWP